MSMSLDYNLQLHNFVSTNKETSTKQDSHIDQLLPEDSFVGLSTTMLEGVAQCVIRQNLSKNVDSKVPLDTTHGQWSLSTRDKLGVCP